MVGVEAAVILMAAAKERKEAAHDVSDDFGEKGQI